MKAALCPCLFSRSGFCLSDLSTSSYSIYSSSSSHYNYNALPSGVSESGTSEYSSLQGCSCLKSFSLHHFSWSTANYIQPFISVTGTLETISLCLLLYQGNEGLVHNISSLSLGFFGLSSSLTISISSSLISAWVGSGSWVGGIGWG